MPGVIETIGTAFGLLNERPYLIWLPVLVDLYLWLGMRLSIQPLTDALTRWISPNLPAGDSSLGTLDRLGQSYDLFHLLVISLPSLLAELGRGSIPGASGHVWIADLPWWALLLVGLLIAIVGVLLGAGYLTMVGYLIRRQGIRPPLLARDTLINFVRTIGYFVIMISLFLMLTLPFVVFSGVLLALGINILPLTAFVLGLGALWLVLLLFFAQDAIVVSGVGPMRAIYLSYNVVRRNWWPCLGFIAVSLIMQRGVPLALQLFTQTQWAVPLALIANAYVATGLVAAAMIFYRDRAHAILSPSPAARAPERGDH